MSYIYQTYGREESKVGGQEVCVCVWGGALGNQERPQWESDVLAGAWCWESHKSVKYLEEGHSRQREQLFQNNLKNHKISSSLSSVDCLHSFLAELL